MENNIMDRDDLLSIEEMTTLLNALSKGNGGHGFTEAEANFVFSWAAKIKFDNIFLDIALGKIGDEGAEAILDIRPDKYTGLLSVAVGVRKTE